jgi:hypothetical protein
MISDLWAILLALPLIAASCAVNAFDVCDSNGYQRQAIGSIRQLKSNGLDYFEYKVSENELQSDAPIASKEMLNSVARDEAISAMYKRFMESNPPSESNGSDLLYSEMESSNKQCSGIFFYAFRVPVQRMSWSEKSENGNDEMLPAVRKMLKDKGFLKN